MATYSSYDQMKQDLIRRGYPPQRAEKLASQKFIRKTGEKPSKLKKAGKAPEPYDPSKKKKNVRKLNSSIELVNNILAEIHGVTGLIASPPSGTAPSNGTTGLSNMRGVPSTPTADKDQKEIQTKATGGSTSKQAFSPKGIVKTKIERAKPGQVAKRPDGVSEASEIFKQIEEEFGIK